MKNDLKTLWFLIFCSLAVLLISGQRAVAYPDGEVCIPSNWAVNEALPTASVNYTVPEPGLTNETMAIFGSAGFEYGNFELWFNCPAPHWDGVHRLYSINEDLGWTIYYLPSETTVTYGGGALNFVSPKNGDEVAAINYSIDYNAQAPLGTPAPPMGTVYASPYPLYVPFSVLPREQLIHLHFNNNALNGDLGQVPKVASNIPAPVPSPFGKGINFDSPSGIDLEYPFFQNDGFTVVSGGLASTGTPNVRRNEGTVRFWFSPNWSSGSGPAGGTFFDMFIIPGYVNTNIWTLAVTNSGSTISLLNAGGGFSRPVSLVSGQWYQITVTYSPTATALYTNGVLAGTGTGVSQTDSTLLSGFRVGSDGNNQQVRGIMDEVRTYNYPMSSTEVLSDYQADCAIDKDGDGVPDLVEFENGIDPSNPSGGDPNQNGPITGSGAPVIQLLDPINAIQN